MLHYSPVQQENAITPIGHSITGATIVMLAMPLHGRRWHKAAAAATGAILANIPDLRLPMWGHYRYDISHSIFVNAAIILILLLPLLCLKRLRPPAGIPVIIACGLAWLSHLLLDMFYNHGLGLAIFWPLGKGRVALPIPWFQTVTRTLPHFDAHSARVWAIELVSYGLACACILLVRQIYLRKRASNCRHIGDIPPS